MANYLYFYNYLLQGYTSTECTNNATMDCAPCNACIGKEESTDVGNFSYRWTQFIHRSKHCSGIVVVLQKSGELVFVSSFSPHSASLDALSINNPLPLVYA